MSQGRRALSIAVAPARIESFGDDGLAREHVAEFQRTRLLLAMREVAAERGASHVTVAEVVSRATVSRRTFYELFDNCEDCFLAALEDATGRAVDRVLSAYRAGGEWLERVRSALLALLSFLDSEPHMGRILIVESLAAGPVVLERRSRVLARIATAVDAGRNQSKRAAELPPLTAEGVVGAVFSVIHGCVTEDDRPALLQLAGPLMGLIALPYLGPAAARRELARPVPRTDTNSMSAGEDPLRELGIRLTYRTVRVLLSVATAPRSSNREIGLASGIADQGQISRLLARLERFDLVCNERLEPGKGEPNAWTLTAKGVEVERRLGTELVRRSEP